MNQPVSLITIISQAVTLLTETDHNPFRSRGHTISRGTTITRYLPRALPRGPQPLPFQTITGTPTVSSPLLPQSLPSGLLRAAVPLVCSSERPLVQFFLPTTRPSLPNLPAHAWSAEESRMTVYSRMSWRNLSVLPLQEPPPTIVVSSSLQRPPDRRHPLYVYISKYSSLGRPPGRAADLMVIRVTLKPKPTPFPRTGRQQSSPLQTREI